MKRSIATAALCLGIGSTAAPVLAEGEFPGGRPPEAPPRPVVAPEVIALNSASYDIDRMALLLTLVALGIVVAVAN